MSKDNVKSKVLVGLAAIAMLIVLWFIGFLVIAGLTFLYCAAFGIEWSWLTALGVWAACVILRWVLSAAKGNGGK